MRLIFMGTPDFSVPALDALVEAGHDIVAVYCQPPSRAGRGKQERPSPVHRRADVLGLQVRHPLNFKSEETQDDFEDLNADLAVVVAYGLLLPQTILDAPDLGCVNIHASLLPRWRGAAPIHRAIMAGDEEAGVCIMQMEAGLDTGPVLSRAATPIAPDDTVLSLHNRLSAIGAELIVSTLAELPELKAEPQPDEGATYAKKILKSEARIDWSKPAIEVDRQIRGLSPFPGAWSEVAGERIKFLDCRVAEGAGAAGEVIGAPLTVACGTGAVEVGRVQRAGKAAMTPDELLRGFDIPVGQKLS